MKTWRHAFLLHLLRPAKTTPALSYFTVTSPNSIKVHYWNRLFIDKVDTVRSTIVDSKNADIARGCNRVLRGMIGVLSIEY